MDSDISILLKKNSTDERNFKSDEDIKNHFLLRLEERYDIKLSDEDYNDIHHPLGFQKSKLIEDYPIHWTKISSSTSAFIVKIKGKFIFALYSRHRKRFITALPWESYDDASRLVPRRLKKPDIKELAIKKYNEILSLCSKEYVDLGSSNKNWHYYKFNCTYPHLLMLEYKGRLTMGDIYNQVYKELNG